MRTARAMKGAALTPVRAGGLAITGAIGFIAIVSILHVLKPGYDFVHQLMSELALVAYGWAMLLAFLFIAGFTVLVALGIAQVQRSPCLDAVLAVATLGFLGAGVFALGSASELHIALIAI